MEKKYLKYKMKYLKLKQMYGGVNTPPNANMVEIKVDTAKEIADAYSAYMSREGAAASAATDSTVTHKKIGEGSSGCAYTPVFKCIHPECISSTGLTGSKSDRCKYGIGKIMEENVADLEYNRYILLDIDNIDPTFRYHFKQPHKCKPEITKADISNCPIHITKPTMLIYDNGEDDIQKLLTKIVYSGKPDIMNKIKQILKGLLNIVEGIRIFNQNGVCHLDIKTSNITSSISSVDALDRLHMRLIDFGMAVKYNIPITPEDVFNGTNGYGANYIKDIIEHFFSYFSLDMLFIGLFNDNESIQSQMDYINNTLGLYLNHIERAAIQYEGRINSWYEMNNFTKETIRLELFDLFNYKTKEDIILKFLETHDTFQFTLMLVEICSFITTPTIEAALNNFINNTNGFHYNPYKRSKSVNLIDHYSQFLREIEVI